MTKETETIIVAFIVTFSHLLAKISQTTSHLVFQIRESLYRQLSYIHFTNKLTLVHFAGGYSHITGHYWYQQCGTIYNSGHKM